MLRLNTMLKNRGFKRKDKYYVGKVKGIWEKGNIKIERRRSYDGKIFVMVHDNDNNRRFFLNDKNHVKMLKEFIDLM